MRGLPGMPGKARERKLALQYGQGVGDVMGNHREQALLFEHGPLRAFFVGCDHGENSVFGLTLAAVFPVHELNHGRHHEQADGDGERHVGEALTGTRVLHDGRRRVVLKQQHGRECGHAEQQGDHPCRTVKEHHRKAGKQHEVVADRSVGSCLGDPAEHHQGEEEEEHRQLDAVGMLRAACGYISKKAHNGARDRGTDHSSRCTESDVLDGREDPGQGGQRH